MGLYQYDSTEDKLNLVAGSTNFSDAPVGAIFPFGGTDIPISFLLCDGSAVSRTDYEDLFNVIGTAFGTGDGSTTFNLPDLREAVPKGAGLTGLSNNHLDADGLALGEFIDDRTMSEFGMVTTGSGSYNVNNSTGGGTYYKLTSNRHGDTTEVKSVGVNYIIKAKMIALPADFMSAVDEAVAESITIKKGTWTGSITLQKMGDSQTRDRFSIPVTFDTPMPDDNYTVVIEFFESRYITIRTASKTTSGFNIEGANTDNVATSTLTKVTWTAIRFPS